AVGIVLGDRARGEGVGEAMYSGVAVYRKVSIESASPTRMLDEVYERMLRACREAGEAIGRKDLAAKGTAIGKALAFLGALEAALDREAAPQLAANLPP